AAISAPRLLAAGDVWRRALGGADRAPPARDLAPIHIKLYLPRARPISCSTDGRHNFHTRIQSAREGADHVSFGNRTHSGPAGARNRGETWRQRTSHADRYSPPRRATSAAFGEADRADRKGASAGWDSGHHALSRD